ncbi:MAG: phosphatase PAP2 family protein [Promethearchaeota archaeon]
MNEDQGIPAESWLKPGYPDKKLLIILVLFILTATIIGALLLSLGLNESFYVSNKSVRAVFSVITFGGDEITFIILLALIFYMIEKRFGKKLMHSFLISVYINTLLKVAIKDPRPDTNLVDGVPIETGFGFPSGHTQLSIAFWCYVLWYVHNIKDARKKMLIYIIGGVMMAIVPVSRMIIGVHDLQDVVGGYIIGLIIFGIYICSEPCISKKYMNLSIFKQLAFGSVIWFAIWVGSALLFPLHADEFGLACGLLIGFSIGFPLEKRWIGFEPQTFIKNKKVISGMIGLALTLGTYVILSFVLGGIEPGVYFWRCLRYFILALFVSTIIPLIINRILKRG